MTFDAKINRYDRWLIWLLRVAGAFILLSIPAIFLPDRWMAHIHEYLGLGQLPQVAIVSYMARSLSAMYALLGVFTIAFSWDVRRYAPIISIWAYLHIVMGVLIFQIDVWSGMPWYWTYMEGPPVGAAGPLVLWLQYASARCDR